MQKWVPMGPVSPLQLPENGVTTNVMAVWTSVGEAHPNASSLDISSIPLVNATEASKFVTQKRAAEHAAVGAPPELGGPPLRLRHRRVGRSPLVLFRRRDHTV